jgi:tetratricopeptide (TPR) repeat protein
VVRCDVREFEDALGAGDRHRAVGLYSGPLLDGFFISGAPEFEQWMDAQRVRLAQSHAQALEALAQACEQAGEHAAAVAWWRRLVEHDPFSSRIALLLMHALVRAGDPAGALQHQRAHDALLREELGVEPPASLSALAAEIRSRPPAHREQDDDARPARRGTGRTAAVPATRADAVPVHAEPSRSRVRRSAWLLGAGALVLFIVFGGLTLGRINERTAALAPPNAADRLAVLPFETRGSPEIAYLGDGMVSLLGVALDGAGGWRTVDARTVMGRLRQAGAGQLDAPTAHRLAELLGSGFYVVGDVVATNGRIRMMAALFNVDDPHTPLVQASAEGDPAQLFSLVDALAAQLLAAGDRGPGQRSVRAAALTTGSVTAFKAYLEGEREMWQGRWDHALLAFQRATAEDSTFALAWYRLSLAAEWFSRGDIQRDAAERAVRHMDRLSDHDRSLLEALLACRRGAAAEAERRYQEIVGAYPDDIEAWFQLGEVWFHYGPLLGRSVAQSRAAWQRVLDVEPGHSPALFHLTRIAALEGRLEELDSLTRRVALLQPESERALEMETFRALLLGSPAERQQVLSALDRASDNTLIITVRTALTYLAAPREADRLVELLTRPHRSVEVRALGHLLLAHTAVARGRWREAQARLDRVEDLLPGRALEQRALLSLAPHLAVSAAELARLRGAVLLWDAAAVPAAVTPGLYIRAHDGVRPAIRLYLLGMLSARLGEHAEAEHYAAALAAAEHRDELARSFAHRVRAESLRVRGLSEHALAELDAARFDQLYDYSAYSAFYSQAYERFMRAELLYELGRPQEALSWYRTLREVSPYEFVHLAPALLAQAAIHVQLEQPEEAAALRRRATELWQDADSGLRPVIFAAKLRPAH